jgi:hypothetical protein
MKGMKSMNACTFKIGKNIGVVVVAHCPFPTRQCSQVCKKRKGDKGVRGRRTKKSKAKQTQV